jgi:FkbM family methyltransferase
MTFSEELLREVIDSVYRRPFYDNADGVRFPQLPGWKLALYDFAARYGFVRAQPSYNREAALTAVDRLEGLEETWTQLQDEYSRRILVLVEAYRMFGSRRIRFPIGDLFSAAIQKTSEMAVQRNTRTAPIVGSLDLSRFDFAGHAIALHGHSLNIVNTFLLEQYRYSRPPGIAALPGDVVVDAGGCWGDTALYFAALAGDHGRVLVAECIPENLAILRDNLALNPKLATCIDVIPKAVGSQSGEKLRFSRTGAGSRPVKEDGPAVEVETTTIDDLVADCPQVNFIKMDIEGTELEALRGAEKTIRRFHPRLAISVYHRPEDLVEIPRFLRPFAYKLYLDHFTTHQEETILFAV